MPLEILISVTAMGPGLSTAIGATGGTEPYTYSVVPGGAGGSIDSDGVYTAPDTISSDPRQSSDTLMVTDDDGDTATGSILITDAVGLLCDVIQQELGLANGRVYLWDQKINQPTDAGLYVAVSVPMCKPFGNTNFQDSSGSGVASVQSLNMRALIDLDIISRGTEAYRRKEEVLMALASNYAQNQQVANSFNIGKLPPGSQFINLSNIDGAAIPYRYRISVSLQYFVRKTQPVAYFDTFADVETTIDP